MSFIVTIIHLWATLKITLNLRPHFPTDFPNGPNFIFMAMQMFHLQHGNLYGPVVKDIDFQTKISG